MSLHKFAEQVASQGRGDDSLLVHMTPDEVRNLQKFAEANGTTLTINPTTGLPEAGMLSDLFKTIAPIALGALLGPAGFGLSATMAGVATGGITALATGSLSRGLMAGLGAYGGAGLADSFMNAGAGAGLSEALAGSSSGNLGQAFGDVAATTLDGSSGTAFNEFLKSNANPATQSFGDMASAGAKAVAENPMDFAKNNLKYLAAAASPIAADLMTPTTTKMPELGNTGYIRQKVYDPYTQTYRSMAPVKANEWGDRQFSDIHRGYNGGGIVALAGGGRFSTVQEGDEYDQYDDGSAAAAATKAAADTAAANVTAAAVTPPQGIATLTQPGVNANQLAANTQFVQQAAQPDTTSAQFIKATSDANIVNQDLADALGASGLSAASQYALLNADIGNGGGLAGLSTNINKALTDPNLTLTQAQGLMSASGTTDADVLRATGRDTTSIFGTRTADAEAKAAAERNAAAAAASKLSADRAAAEKAAADKAAADKFAADKAAADKASADARAKTDADAISKTLADKAAAEKAAAEKANADRIAAAIAADEKAAAERAAAAKAALEAKYKKEQDEIAAGKLKGAADKTAYEKSIADAAAAKAAADKLARDKAIADKVIADKIIADKIAADKAIADKIAADKAAAKAIADKIAADKAAADAAAKAIADGLSAAAAAAAAEKARREKIAADKEAADKKIADDLAAANVVTSIGTVDLLTNTGVTQDKTDTTTTGPLTLATTTPGSIKSSVTTDGTYVGTTGETPPIGTKVGVGTIAGTGTEASTGTTGPIINYGGTPGFTVAPLTLAQTQIAEQAAATNAAQNTQLDLYRSWVNQNPNATDIQHANFLDKINLSPDVAARATPLSGQQMKNRYYDAKYNKMTGDSQSAYNFLMGKGAYPTKSGVGEIMRPYSEATLGMPASTNKKYIFDPTTRSYKLNQDYVGTTRDSTGAVNYTMSPREIYNYFVKNAGQADSKTYDWAIENNLTPEEIAASTGVPLSTVAAKWRDAKAKKDAAAKDATKTVAAGANTVALGGTNYDITDKTTPPPEDNNGQWTWDDATKKWVQYGKFAAGGIAGFAMGGMPMYAVGGGLGSLGSYSDGGRLLRGPGDGVSDSIPATIGQKQQPARLADGEFVVPARIVSELGNGSTEAGAKKLYAMMDRVQRARGKTTGKNKVAANSRADKHLPA
jgi:hypothetical protein